MDIIPNFKVYIFDGDISVITNMNDDVLYLIYYNNICYKIESINPISFKNDNYQYVIINSDEFIDTYFPIILNSIEYKFDFDIEPAFFIRCIEDTKEELYELITRRQ